MNVQNENPIWTDLFAKYLLQYTEKYTVNGMSEKDAAIAAHLKATAKMQQSHSKVKRYLAIAKTKAKTIHSQTAAKDDLSTKERWFFKAKTIHSQTAAKDDLSTKSIVLKILSFAFTAYLIIWFAWQFLEAPVQTLEFVIVWFTFLLAMAAPLALLMKLSFKLIANEEVTFVNALGSNIGALFIFIITFIALAVLTIGIANAGFGKGTSQKIGPAGLIPIIFISSVFSYWLPIGSSRILVNRYRPLGLFSKHALFISLIMAVPQLLIIALAIWLFN